MPPMTGTFGDGGYLDALGASQTPTGTSTSPKKVTTPGGNYWMGGGPI